MSLLSLPPSLVFVCPGTDSSRAATSIVLATGPRAPGLEGGTTPGKLPPRWIERLDRDINAAPCQLQFTIATVSLIRFHSTSAFLSLGLLVGVHFAVDGRSSVYLSEGFDSLNKVRGNLIVFKQSRVLDLCIYAVLLGCVENSGLDKLCDVGEELSDRICHFLLCLGELRV